MAGRDVTRYTVGPWAAPDRIVHEGKLKLVALCLVWWRWNAEPVGRKAQGGGGGVVLNSNAAASIQNQFKGIQLYA
jgi:hypothetical protein